MRIFILLAKILKDLARAESLKKGKGKPGLGKIACNQKARLVAHSLKRYIIESVTKDTLALSRPTGFKTRALGKSETPMFDSGALLDHLHVKKVRDCTYMVYWDDRRVYEKKDWTAKDIVEFHRDRHQYTLEGEAKRKAMAWYWIRVKKAGLSKNAVRNPQGRKNTITFRARPFFDRAVKRFKTRFSGKSGINIYTHERDHTAVMVRVS